MKKDLSALTPRASAAVKMLKSLANEHRLMVLCLLHEGERTVGEIESHVGLSQSALSQHLARLRSEGIVKTRREQQTIFYSLASREVSGLIQKLHSLYCNR